MSDHGVQQSKKLGKSQLIDSAVPSYTPSLSAKSVTNSIQSLHSDSLTNNIDGRSAKYSELHELPTLLNMSTPHMRNDNLLPRGNLSSNSSLHSVSTDSTDTTNTTDSSNSSIRSVSTDSSDTEDDSL